ncbi:hypothetical protein BOX15_Mlig033128g4 [Macrostomum lignano]|uniref:Uncharacterized protein n=1 Tax=Macrostomum lignano TaxID=282301 RepID=A0A267FV88_9PLAT|nr:hypothetical protein BOX15_Mlig033128g4 [Macrostomum lignano]
MVLTNKEASFVIHATGQGELDVKITDPSGRPVDFKRQSRANGMEVRWTPRVNGPHQIRAVGPDGQTIPGYPATVNAYDPKQVRVLQKTQPARLAEPVHFEVDTYEAGSGQLSATAENMVTREIMDVDCNIKSPYVYDLVFTPITAGEYELQVCLNGELVPTRLRFTPVSEIETVIVSDSQLNDSLYNPPARRQPSKTKSQPKQQPPPPPPQSSNNGTGVVSDSVDSGGGPYQAHIVVTADLDRLNFDMPVADYGKQPDSPTSTLRSNKSIASLAPVVDVQVPQYVPIHHTIEFEISGIPTKAAFRVTVKNPHGQMEECENRRSGGQLFITFTPHLSGAHRFFVEVNNRFVSDTEKPPYCLAFDWTKITSKLKSPVGFLDEPVVVEVDASKCGGGLVECQVKLRKTFSYRGSVIAADSDSVAGNDNESVSGSVASRVRNYGSLVTTKPDDRYVISFNPDRAGVYELNITYDNFPIPDAPFVIPVVDFASIRLTGQGLRVAPIFSVAWYRIEVLNGPSKHLSMTVTNPLNLPVDCTLTKWNDGLLCEWTPDLVGMYYLQIYLGDRLLDRSSFDCHAYDISKVKVTEYDKVGIVGQRMRFEISAEGASGDGVSEICPFVLPLSDYKALKDKKASSMAESEAGVPLDYRTKSSNVVEYTFVPQDGQQHVIEVFFNEQSLQQCPIMVHVMSELDILNQLVPTSFPWVPCCVETRLRFGTRLDGYQLNVQPDRLAAVVRAPSRGILPNRVSNQRDSGEFHVHFTPLEAGPHHVEMSYGGQPIKGSPFTVNVYDPSRLKITYEDRVTITRPATVSVDLTEAGEAPLQLKVVPPSGSHLAVQEVPSGQSGVIRFDYVPAEIGIHELTLFFNGAEVEGCPLQQVARSPEMAVAHGEGLVEALLNQPTHFFVDPKGQRGDLFVQVDGPTTITSCHMEPMQNGQYRVSYTPGEVGHHSVQVRWNDEPVPGSPFQPIVIDLNSISCLSGGPQTPGTSQLPPLLVGRLHRIVFDVSRAGPGRLSAEVTGPSREPLNCSVHGDSLEFTPTTPGDHQVRVWFGDKPVPNTPFRGNAELEEQETDNTKVVLSGRGLKEARVKEEAAFLVDGSQAGRGRPAIRMTSAESSGGQVEVQCRSIGDDKYKCTYTPHKPGAYLLHINWVDRPLRGSPFTVQVLGQSEANRIVCSGEGLRQGVIGQEIKATIDTRRAGPGDLTARCHGPNKPAFCELFDHQDCAYTLSVRPQEPGKHVLVIEYNGEQVPGSPFSLRVSPAPDASKVRVFGPGIEHGVIDSFESRFVCETKGAGAGQLTVRIRGPRGAFHVEMEREYQKDRTIMCHYDPSEAGEYQIHIRWSGAHVPGSPFVVNLFRSRAELEDYLTRNPGEASGRRYQNGTPFDF